MTAENLAIVFTDVVGSTEQSHLLPQETADEVRRRHFSTLRRAIAQSGGKPTTHGRSSSFATESLEGRFSLVATADVRSHVDPSQPLCACRPSALNRRWYIGDSLQG